MGNLIRIIRIKINIRIEIKDHKEINSNVTVVVELGIR